MPALTLNFGYLLQQAIMFVAAGLGSALILLALAGLAKLRLWPRSVVLRLVAEAPIVCLGLAGIELLAHRAGWLHLLPGWPSMFMIVALWLYWGAIYWPLRVLARRRSLRGAKGATPLRIAALGAPLLAIWGCFVEPNWLEAEPVELHHPDVHGGAIRIAHISDLQLVDFGFRERELVAQVTAFRPHLVILSGDYMTGELGEDTAIAAARTVIASLHPSHGTYATSSDSTSELQARRIFQGLDVQYLLNRNVALDVAGTAVRIGGINHYYPRWDLVRRGASAAELFLVACHQPDLVDDCEQHVPETDLFFCGHTHGGQVQIPFYGPLVTLTRRTSRKVAAGGVFRTAGGMTLLLSRGVGMEGEYAPRLRLNCRPHLFLLTLRGTEETK